MSGRGAGNGVVSWTTLQTRYISAYKAETFATAFRSSSLVYVAIAPLSHSVVLYCTVLRHKSEQEPYGTLPEPLADSCPVTIGKHVQVASQKKTTYSLHNLTASLRELPGAPAEALKARIATLQRSRSALSSGVKQ